MASLSFNPTKTHFSPDPNPIKTHWNRALCLRRRVFAAAPASIRRSWSDRRKRGVNAAEMERWVRGSVAEIVKNLHEDSPLVVEVYAESSESNARFKVYDHFGLTEEVTDDGWTIMRNELEKRGPDGLIFVEQLSDEDEDQEDDDEDESGDRCWGIVIQGRGGECAPICYLLKTCKAMAAMGMDLSCTHFCLVKVKSFSESAFGHFMNSWLSK